MLLTTTLRTGLVPILAMVLVTLTPSGCADDSKKSDQPADDTTSPTGHPTAGPSPSVPTVQGTSTFTA